MAQTSILVNLLIGVHIALQVLFVGRALLRPYRDPESRLAWVLVIVIVPVAGIVAYILVGETSIGRRQIERMRHWLEALPAPVVPRGAEPKIPEEYAAPFHTGQSVNGYPPVGGNRALLLPDSDAAIDAIVADIDAARHHVHLLFFIWLPDNNGLKVAEAVKRAAARGVACRVLADDVGSRDIIGTHHWSDMERAGVQIARAMPVGNPLLAPLWGRIDIRNHRKIIVIDNRIAYCGSQNCADPAFAVKAKYGPWIDIMMRFEGPIVWQSQHLFASDWMGHGHDNIEALLKEPVEVVEGGFAAQMIGTGVTARPTAMPEVFVSLMSAARQELVISTPYYVPEETIQAALCACAYRGVPTTFIVPHRNDSLVVAAASHSYYRELLTAGVRIREYVGGLLHAKTLTIDGEVTLIGSANMDRRSFELNFENNILFYDPATTARVRERQQAYIDASVAVERETVESWTWPRRIWNNTVAMLGPVI
jgi:cardiolipin synthase A/B